MGAWGHKVWDNDDASDVMVWVSDLLEKISKKKFADPNEIRAVAEIVLKLDKVFIFDSPLVKMLQDKLQNILNDKEWIESWNSEGEIKKDLRRQIRCLDKLMIERN